MTNNNQQYFRCDPNLCGGAACCQGEHTKPSLSVADYLRLSKHTREPMVEIWKTKGDIFLSHLSVMQEGEFGISLGLLHDPCPYLTNLKCSVHDAKPASCRYFPLHAFIKSPEELETNRRLYACLRGVRLSKSQSKFVHELDKIMENMASLDVKYFYNERPPRISIPTTGHFFRLAKQALDLQSARDPSGNSVRSYNLTTAVNKMSGLIETGEINRDLSNDEYASMLSPIIFCLLEDKIARGFESLDDSVLRLFRKANHKLDKIKI